MATANAGQIDHVEPGPINDSVLTLQAKYQSEAIWNGQVKHNTKTICVVLNYILLMVPHLIHRMYTHTLYHILIHGFILCRIRGPLLAAVVVKSSPI